MLYAAKCFWPGVTEREVEQVAIRAGLADRSTESEQVLYVGSLLFTGDDLVLCLFDAPSRAAVKRASEEAGIPCERVMDSVWLGSHGSAPTPQTTSRRRQPWDMLGTSGR